MVIGYGTWTHTMSTSESPEGNFFDLENSESALAPGDTHCHTAQKFWFIPAYCFHSFIMLLLNIISKARFLLES
jgi:hypothetical protein